MSSYSQAAAQSWKVSGISNKVNQIYQIKNGQIGRLVEDAGISL